MTKKKPTTRPLSGFDELDNAGIGAGYQGAPVDASPAAAPTPTARSWGDAVTDTGRGIASGVGGLVKGAGTLYGLATGDMENGATELGDTVQKYWEEGQSQQLKDKRTKRQAAIDSADGTLAKAGTALWETVKDPALAMDTVATNAATMLPGMAVGRLASGAKAAQGLAAASKFGPASLAAREAALKAAGSLGTKVAIGAGAIQQGADVSQDVYESAMKKPNEAWAQNPEFMAAFAKTDGSEKALQDTKHDFALTAARVTMPAAAAISLGANAIPGADMLERALVGGGARVAGKGGVAAVAKSMGKAALGEGAQETLEEGGGAFAGNVAKQKFVDPNQDVMEKVGENAGMGAAGGILMGAGGGAFHGHAQGEREDPAAAAAKALAEQQAAARKAAVGAAHAAAATPNSPIARAAAAANPLTPEEAWAKAQELDAQAALDEANGVEQVGPPAEPPAQQDGAMDALVAHQNADPTIQESLQVQPAPAFDAQAAQEQYRADTLAAQKAQDDELNAQAEAALAKMAQRKQQTRPVNEVVSDGGYLYEGTQDGDVLNGLGKPFSIKMGALQEAKRQARENGGDWTVAPVFDGYVARKKEASNVGVQDGTEPRSAEPAELAGDNANAGMGDRPVDRLPEGDNPLGADADPLGQSGEQAGGVVADAVSLTREDAIANASNAAKAVLDSGGTPADANRAATDALIEQMATTPGIEIAQDAPAAVKAAQTRKKPLAGQPIDKDWTAFHPESGTLDVPRADMPQIEAGHRGAMVNFLKARGISSTQEEVPTESLKPTQREYSPEKVEKAKGFKGNDRSILVSSDGHVLDGHHQWVAKHEAGEPVKVIRLDAPIDALLSAVREFPSAETTVNSTTQEQASEKAAKAEQESAKPEAAAGNSAVHDSGADQPAAEQAGAGKAEVASPDSFVKSPGGSLDFGEITPEMSKAMHRQAGKIRLRQGNAAWGLTHIEQRHGKDFAALGFNSALEFVSKVASGFTKIYQGRGAAIDVVIDDESRGMLIVQLEPSSDGDFYDIKTATPIRRDQFKNEKPLWERDGPIASTADKGGTSYPRGQSGTVSLPEPAESSKRPKNWENNYGAASKIAEGLNIALRGANGKMKKVPELVADIKALDVGGKPSPDGDGQHDELDSEMRAYGERATRIESTLANGGHVVGDQLRSNNGMGLMKLTPAELTRIPENKVREKPDPEKARVDTVKNQPKIDTSAEPVQKPAESGQVDAPQIEWTRTRNVDRMGIALKAGFKESVAESLSKRSWSSLDVVVQEKLAEAMAEPQEKPSEPPAAPTGEDALYTRTAKLTQPYTLDDFIGNVDAGYRAHFDYAGADGRTLWIEHLADGGWVLKSKDDDSASTYTKGGVGYGGRWNKAEAMRNAQEDAKYRFTEWKPIAGVMLQSSGEKAAITAGFKYLTNDHTWVKTVRVGEKRSELFNIREFGPEDDRSYRATKATSFPGTGATGSPSVDMGTFKTLDAAVQATGKASKFQSSSPAVQDFIDGKRDDAPTIEEVKAEPSPLIKAMNFLMELEARQAANGMIGDDRLETKIRQQKAVVKELQDAANKPAAAPSQEASNTIKSSPSEDAAIEAKTTIEQLDAQIKRHEELLGCLG